MNIVQNVSDDQLALIGCLAALTGSMVIMYFSYFISSAARRARSENDLEANRILRTERSDRSNQRTRESAA